MYLSCGDHAAPTLVAAFSSASSSSTSSSSSSKEKGASCGCGWTKITLLGRGAHGQVFLCRLDKTGEEVAVKQVVVDGLTDRDLAGTMVQEINLIKDLKHPHIVRYIGTHQCGNCLNIVLEYCANGSLRQMLQSEGALSENRTAIYTKQVLEGLSYLHENGIAHRDVKGANVLVAGDGKMKLADFGASKRLGHDSVISGLKGTPHWMAPEIIKGVQTNQGWKKADVWSLGCTVVEMLTGKMPWPMFPNPIAAMYHIANGQCPPLDRADASPAARDFVNKCCTLCPEKRPTIQDLLCHPFVQCASLSSHPSTTNSSLWVPPPPIITNTQRTNSSSSSGGLGAETVTSHQIPNLNLNVGITSPGMESPYSCSTSTTIDGIEADGIGFFPSSSTPVNKSNSGGLSTSCFGRVLSRESSGTSSSSLGIDKLTGESYASSPRCLMQREKEKELALSQMMVGSSSSSSSPTATAATSGSGSTTNVFSYSGISLCGGAPPCSTMISMMDTEQHHHIPHSESADTSCFSSNHPHHQEYHPPSPDFVRRSRSTPGRSSSFSSSSSSSMNYAHHHHRQTTYSQAASSAAARGLTINATLAQERALFSRGFSNTFSPVGEECSSNAAGGDYLLVNKSTSQQQQQQQQQPSSTTSSSSTATNQPPSWNSSHMMLLSTSSSSTTNNNNPMYQQLIQSAASTPSPLRTEMSSGDFDLSTSGIGLSITTQQQGGGGGQMMMHTSNSSNSLASATIAAEQCCSKFLPPEPLLLIRSSSSTCAAVRRDAIHQLHLMNQQQQEKLLESSAGSDSLSLSMATALSDTQAYLLQQQQQAGSIVPRSPPILGRSRSLSMGGSPALPGGGSTPSRRVLPPLRKELSYDGNWFVPSPASSSCSASSSSINIFTTANQGPPSSSSTSTSPPFGPSSRVISELSTSPLHPPTYHHTTSCPASASTPSAASSTTTASTCAATTTTTAASCVKRNNSKSNSSSNRRRSSSGDSSSGSNSMLLPHQQHYRLEPLASSPLPDHHHHPSIKMINRRGKRDAMSRGAPRADHHHHHHHSSQQQQHTSSSTHSSSSSSSHHH